MSKLTKGEPLYFRRLPKPEGTPTNAEYSRDLGMLNGDHFHEIEYCQEMWIVRELEFDTINSGRAKAATAMNKKIAAKTTPEITKKDLAAELGIAPHTLNNRLDMIEKYLPKVTVNGESK